MTRACGYVKNVDITYFSVESEKKKEKIDINTKLPKRPNIPILSSSIFQNVIII